MFGYNSFGSKNHRRSSSAPIQSSDDDGAPSPRAHYLYSTPIFSAPLITAFGLPTLIECAVEEDTPPSPEFTSLRARNRSPSPPAQRALAKSAIGDISSDAEHSINAYTYRVRTNNNYSPLDTISLDEHRLRLSKNTDGTYSQLTPTMLNEEYGRDDVAKSDTGLLMSSDLRTSVSGDTVLRLEETLTDMDRGALPPHVHPSIPPEMLNPKYTKTTPPLKLWPLAVLVFYNVSGGPFGIEPSIRAGGNFYAILGFIIFPLVWSVPEALITAELGAAFQDPSAGVAWVEEAFGETMACLCGYLAWVSGATDNAIYPTLFMEYVSSVAGWNNDDFGGWAR